MKAKLDPQILTNLQQPSSLSVSPSGKHVAYVTKRTCRNTGEAAKSQIWIAEMGKEHSAHPLTGEDYRVRDPQFRPGHQSFAFLSNQHNDETSNFALFMQSIDGGKPTTLTTSTKHGSILSFRWSPDGGSIALVAPLKRMRKVHDVKVYGEDSEYNILWQLTVSDGKLSQISSSREDVNLFDWNDDGTKIVYCTAAETNFDSPYLGQNVWAYELKSQVLASLVQFQTKIENLCWTSNGILFKAFSEPTETSHSYSLYRIEERTFTKVAYGDTNDAYGVKSCGGTTLVHIQDGMKDSVRTFDGTILWQGQQQILDWDGHFDKDQQKVVLITSTTGVPPEVYSVEDGQMCQLSQHGRDIAEMKLSKCQVVQYEQDGVPMDGYYCIPTSLQSQFDQRKPLKTIVVVKGGPSGRGTNNFEGLLCWDAHLLSLGYLLLYPNYRGGTSHGDSYARAVRGNPAVCYEDVIWMTKKGIEEGWIDRNHVAIAGWSNGGYITYLAVTRDSTFHFKAAIAGAGVTDWYLDTCLTDMTKYMSEIMGCEPWDKNAPLEMARNGSPIDDVQEVKTPLLMLHGEDDPRVPVENALIFRKALSALGKKDFEMAIYPGEGHQADWTRDHVVDYLERMTRFLKKYMP